LDGSVQDRCSSMRRRVAAATRDVQARERELAPRRGRPIDSAPLIPPRDWFAQLDVLRGLPALVVVLAHYSSHGMGVVGFRHGLDLMYAFHALTCYRIIACPLGLARRSAAPPPHAVS